MRRRLLRTALTAALALAGFGMFAASSQASIHETLIREVSGGTAGSDNSYIEIQMYSAGQNLASGSQVHLYDADGATGMGPGPIIQLALSGANPPNADNQRTILIGDTNVVGKDFTLDLSSMEAGGLVAAAGAACFPPAASSVGDCVSWGAGFTGAANLPDDATPLGTGLPVDNAMALRRDILRGCNTLLQAPAIDDTNSSADDFDALARVPTPNSAVPTETPCVLTLAVNGFGTVTGNGINCPGDCTQTYSNGENANLVPATLFGSTFSNWIGCPAQVGDDCPSPMNISRSITANFTGGSLPVNPPPTLTPVLAPVTTTTTTTPRKKCKKGFRLKRGKCRRKKK